MTESNTEITLGEGVRVRLTAAEERLMLFVREAKAIGKGEITATNIRPPVFDRVRQILYTAQYDIKAPVRVNTVVLKDLLDEPLCVALQNMPIGELNELYRAVHFLKIPAMRKVIAAVLASRVYFERTPSAYAAKKAALGIHSELTHAEMQDYKERFPFMN